IMGGFTGRRSIRRCVNWIDHWPVGRTGNTRSCAAICAGRRIGSRVSRDAIRSCGRTGSWECGEVPWREPCELRGSSTVPRGARGETLCQMTGLSRAGFYRWRVPRQATPVEMELRDQMQKVALEWPAYGYRRITSELQQHGFAVNHKRVLRMLREDNLLCVRRRGFVV